MFDRQQPVPGFLYVSYTTGRGSAGEWSRRSLQKQLTGLPSPSCLQAEWTFGVEKWMQPMPKGGWCQHPSTSNSETTVSHRQ